MVENALQIIREKDPRALLLQYHNIKSNIECIFARHLVPYRLVWDYSTFKVAAGIQAWLE